MASTKLKASFWVNIGLEQWEENEIQCYRLLIGGIYRSKELADKDAGPARIDCQQVFIETFIEQKIAEDKTNNEHSN